MYKYKEREWHKRVNEYGVKVGYWETESLHTDNKWCGHYNHNEAMVGIWYLVNPNNHIIGKVSYDDVGIRISHINYLQNEISYINIDYKQIHIEEYE